ncbi:MAG TPA: SDR family NAD(P)-dependent oxidoreductase [Bryobacteraceae bacterium]|nr:SDR family NAD(P)-dependent oxidoreductase [Bryobacteraceae bacterium]
MESEQLRQFLPLDISMQCVVNYRQRRDDALAIVDTIEREGGRAIAVQGDVASESDDVRIFGTVDKELGGITALVNNAATFETQARLESVDTARLQRIFATNVFGPFLCSREAVKRMSTRHGGWGGNIVNISSVAARGVTR